jgi:hypothetical protein
MSTTTRRFRRNAGDVYAVIADPRTYPAWLSGARRIRWIEPGWPEPGTSFGHEVGAGPVRTKDTTTATAAVPGQSLELVVRARPFIKADVRFVVSRERPGCMVTLEESARGWHRVLAPFISPMTRLRNERSLQRLARYLGEPE